MAKGRSPWIEFAIRWFVASVALSQSMLCWINVAKSIQCHAFSYDQWKLRRMQLRCHHCRYLRPTRAGEASPASPASPANPANPASLTLEDDETVIIGNRPTVQIFYDSLNHLHRDIRYLPECPERIDHCLNAIRAQFLYQDKNENVEETAMPSLHCLHLVDVAPNISDAAELGQSDTHTSHTSHTSYTSQTSHTASFFEYPSPLTEQERIHAQTILQKIHSPTYLTSLQTKCNSCLQSRIDEGKHEGKHEGKPPLGWIGYVDGSDTYVTTESYNVGLRGAGAWIRAVDVALGYGVNGCRVEDDDGGQLFPLMMRERATTTSSSSSSSSSSSFSAQTEDAASETSNSKIKSSNRTIGVALTRPPGHHATYTDPNGFCLFNFAMAAAAHALWRNKDLKISILDWDVHFGQGLMDILDKCRTKHTERDTREDKDGDYDWTSHVRYVSLHQVPCFPYEGQKRGVQGKYGNVMTVPIAPESTWHCGYRELFTEYALPFIRTPRNSKNFKNFRNSKHSTKSSNAPGGDGPAPWEPDLVIVCAGYDALDSDELASVNLVAKDYGKMTRILCEHLGCLSSSESASVGKMPALVFGLEGGYQLRESVAGGNLGDALVETLKALQ